jgi:hypothetical protein
MMGNAGDGDEGVVSPTFVMMLSGSGDGDEVRLRPGLSA